MQGHPRQMLSTFVFLILATTLAKFVTASTGNQPSDNVMVKISLVGEEKYKMYLLGDSMSPVLNNFELKRFIYLRDMFEIFTLGQSEKTAILPLDVCHCSSDNFMFLIETKSKDYAEAVRGMSLIDFLSLLRCAKHLMFAEFEKLVASCDFFSDPANFDTIIEPQYKHIWVYIFSSLFENTRLLESYFGRNQGFLINVLTTVTGLIKVEELTLTGQESPDLLQYIFTSRNTDGSYLVDFAKLRNEMNYIRLFSSPESDSFEEFRENSPFENFLNGLEDAELFVRIVTRYGGLIVLKDLDNNNFWDRCNSSSQSLIVIKNLGACYVGECIDSEKFKNAKIIRLHIAFAFPADVSEDISNLNEINLFEKIERLVIGKISKWEVLKHSEVWNDNNVKVEIQTFHDDDDGINTYRDDDIAVDASFRKRVVEAYKNIEIIHNIRFEEFSKNLLNLIKPKLAKTLKFSINNTRTTYKEVLETLGNDFALDSVCFTTCEKLPSSHAFGVDPRYISTQFNIDRRYSYFHRLILLRLRHYLELEHFHINFHFTRLNEVSPLYDKDNRTLNTLVMMLKKHFLSSRERGWNPKLKTISFSFHFSGFFDPIIKFSFAIEDVVSNPESVIEELALRRKNFLYNLEFRFTYCRDEEDLNFMEEERRSSIEGNADNSADEDYGSENANSDVEDGASDEDGASNEDNSSDDEYNQDSNNNNDVQGNNEHVYGGNNEGMEVDEANSVQVRVVDNVRSNGNSENTQSSQILQLSAPLINGDPVFNLGNSKGNKGNLNSFVNNDLDRNQADDDEFFNDEFLCSGDFLGLNSHGSVVSGARRVLGKRTERDNDNPDGDFFKGKRNN